MILDIGKLGKLKKFLSYVEIISPICVTICVDKITWHTVLDILMLHLFLIISSVRHEIWLLCTYTNSSANAFIRLLGFHMFDSVWNSLHQYTRWISWRYWIFKQSSPYKKTDGLYRFWTTVLHLITQSLLLNLHSDSIIGNCVL